MTEYFTNLMLRMIFYIFLKKESSSVPIASERVRSFSATALSVLLKKLLHWRNSNQSRIHRAPFAALPAHPTRGAAREQLRPYDVPAAHFAPVAGGALCNYFFILHM